MKECKAAILTKMEIDGVEQKVIVMPITRLDCIEDTADSINSADSGDYIPIIDSADNGQMKKIKFSDLILAMSVSLDETPAMQEIISKAETAQSTATAAQTAVTEIQTKIESGEGVPASTLGGKTADDFADAEHTHTTADITNMPTSLPANGGNADTVDNAHVVTTAALGLHRMASGTAAPTSATCPPGCWYGQYE